MDKVAPLSEFINNSSSKTVIPQSIRKKMNKSSRLDGQEHLSRLFKLIYEQKTLSEQWLVAKTVPIFKNKAETKNIEIENYRPIASFWVASKIFEK